MPDYDHLRTLIRQKLRAKKRNSSTIVSASTLSDALMQAAKNLGVREEHISYQLIDTDSNTDNRQVKIVAKIIGEHTENTEHTPDEYPSDISDPHDNAVADIDTRCSLRVLSHEIVLRISRGPDGRVPQLSDVYSLIDSRLHTPYNRPAVADIVQHASGEYIKIAEFEHQPSDNPTIHFDSDSSGYSGWITLSAPGMHGIDPTQVMYEQALKKHGVVFGIDNALLEKLEYYPQYGRRIKVATGQHPQSGDDAQLVFPNEYAQSTDNSSNNDNFRAASRITNVLANSVIAKKIPAKPGTDGINIFGVTSPATDGEDIVIHVGKHASLSDDGNEAISKINGELKVSNGIVDVLPVHKVAKDVNIKCGNIIFLGAVIVPGNVEDGFSVKASGSIEIGGFVGKAVIDSEEDIIIHGGIVGKNNATVNSDKNIITKYIENATVHAGDSIIVSEGVINSHLIARNTLTCRGKRASIVGGSVICGSHIKAKTIGSHLGTNTVIQTGLDTKRLLMLNDLVEQHELLREQLAFIVRMERKGDPPLPNTMNPTQQNKMSHIQQEKAMIKEELQGLTTDMEQLRKEIHATQVSGSVVIEREIYAGVTLTINNTTRQVRARQGRYRYTDKNGEIHVETLIR